MKAYTKNRYGGPEVLQFEEVEKPPLKPDHLLVKVIANSANPADWHILRGEPYFARLSFGLFKPKTKILGADFSGIVEAVGSNAGQFRVGDRVFGESLIGGAFAEYISVPAAVCAPLPAEIPFVEGACLPIAGLTALQALIDHGRLRKGESVLINGSSGGVGHLAVQIAKCYGARVTGVCSAKNAEFVSSLGADNVIAYDNESIHHHKGRYNLVVDTHGNLFHEDFQRLGDRGVLVGFTTLKHMIKLHLRKSLSKFPLAQFTAEANTTDLDALASLVRRGAVRVHTERVYSFREIPQAISHIEAMRTRGKVAMVWQEYE